MKCGHSAGDLYQKDGLDAPISEAILREARIWLETGGEQNRVHGAANADCLGGAGCHPSLLKVIGLVTTGNIAA